MFKLGGYTQCHLYEFPSKVTIGMILFVSCYICWYNPWRVIKGLELNDGHNIWHLKGGPMLKLPCDLKGNFE